MSGQQQSMITKKKSKCRGNRRLQRFKRKWYKNGLDHDTISKLISNYVSTDRLSNHRIIEEQNEVKNEALDHTEETAVEQQEATTSVDQDVQSNTKYQCIEGYWSSMIGDEPEYRPRSIRTKNHRSSYQNSSLPMDHWKKSPFFVPQYEKMDKSLFLESLAHAVPQYRQDILAWLSDSKIFKFVKQYIHDAALIYQHEIELKHWDTVAGMVEPVLTLLKRECRQFIRQNYIHWDYPQTIQNIQHRQRLLRNRLNQHRAMSDHSMKSLSCIGLSKAATNILHQAVNTVIQTDFRNYCNKLNEKLILLQYDMDDIQLVRSFYRMHPNHAQIEAARRLWRLQYKANKRAIAQFKLALQGRKENLDADANIHYQSALQQSRQSHDNHMKLRVHERLANMASRNRQLLQIIQNNSSHAIKDTPNTF